MRNWSGRSRLARVFANVRLVLLSNQLGFYLSQERLDELASLGSSHISGFERSVGNPKIGTLGRVADALGVPHSELIHAADL